MTEIEQSISQHKSTRAFEKLPFRPPYHRQAMQIQNVHDIDEEMSHLCIAMDGVCRLEGDWVHAEDCVQIEDAYVPSQVQETSFPF